jgi:cytidylate kinase
MMPANNSPQHGDRGQATPAPRLEKPAALSIAISREAGARGHSIAHAVGEVLGWQVYPQEMLDFLTHDEDARAQLLQDVSANAIQWAELETAKLLVRRKLPPDHDAAAVARLIFTLAARGEAVLVGRGAGFILPKETTVHARIVAPFDERTAYLAQWLRMTEAEAAQEAIQRDSRRAAFIGQMTDFAIHDPTAYDVLLNSSRLTNDNMAQTLAQLVRLKASRNEPSDPEMDAIG